jgi:hypothetical protein
MEAEVLVRAEMGGPDRPRTLADGRLRARNDRQVPGADRASITERDQTLARAPARPAAGADADDLLWLSPVLDQSVLHGQCSDRIVMKIANLGSF